MQHPERIAKTCYKTYSLYGENFVTLQLKHFYRKSKKLMEDYDDLGSYNGDVEHDMWVDYDHYQNTGEPDVFDEEDIDDIIDELNE